MLASISLILLAAICNQKAVTPPTAAPPPLVSEAKTPPQCKSLLERTIYRNVAVTNFIEKAVVWLLAAMEILSVITTHFRHSNVAQHALGLLFTGAGHPERIWRFYVPWSCGLVLGTAFISVGGVIRLLCFRTMGEMFTFQHTMKKEHKLMTTGPYSVVRHPSYSGMILILVGTAVWQAAPGSWARESGYLSTILGALGAALVMLWLMILVGAFVLRSAEEDVALQGHFGDEWHCWANVVRYRLVPGVY